MKALPDWAKNPNRTTVLYNGMIHPLIPYGIRGRILVSGRATPGAAYAYRTRFPDMIRNGREDWAQGDFPFFSCSWRHTRRSSPSRRKARGPNARGAALTSEHCPNTAMAVITDTAARKSIHPKQKEPVGGRLALAARAIAYDEKIVYRGPVYRSVAFKGTVRSGVRQRRRGMVANDGDLKGFANRRRGPQVPQAVATVVGDRVVVSSPDVPKPVAVRYGWGRIAPS